MNIMIGSRILSGMTRDICGDFSAVPDRCQALTCIDVQQCVPGKLLEYRGVITSMLYIMSFPWNSAASHMPQQGSSLQYIMRRPRAEVMTG